MMRKRKWLMLGALAALWIAPQRGFSQADPGKKPIGQVSFTVYYATDGDPAAAGERTVAASKAVETRLRGEERLSFKHYRILGHEVQPLLRSYENWAQPLRPSDEVLVRFEASSKPTKEATNMDLELWLSRKKILKTDVRLTGNVPLFILGPEWRGGRLIIAAALAPKEKPGS
jgi:hypothetical protein